jgi:hypothetical protein
VRRRFNVRVNGPGATESRFDEATHGDRSRCCADFGASGADEQRSRDGCSVVRSAPSDAVGEFVAGDSANCELFFDYDFFDRAEIDDLDLDLDDDDDNGDDDTNDCAHGGDGHDTVGSEDGEDRRAVDRCCAG